MNHDIDYDPDPRVMAFKKFRRSVGFQFMFVLYSGLEVSKAIDHVVAAAETLLASTDTKQHNTKEGSR